MFGGENISAELPAPRDDEPASLRQDIVDELRDHLQCAFHRELHTASSRGCISADQSPHDAAHQRVLVRFGNPASIARRLWWDVMKETIMSQRITAAMSSVAALACCVMLVLVWQMQAANRALVEQSQSLNAQMLDQMQALANNLRAATDGNEAPSEWNRLRLKCVADREDGPPLSRVRAYLTSASENTRGIPPIKLTSGDDGMLDFGVVLYGQYSVELTAPNGMQMSRTISVRPGQDALETIVGPADQGLVATVLRPELIGGHSAPEALRDRIWYRFQLQRKTIQSEWCRRLPPDQQESLECFIAPDGRFYAPRWEQAEPSQLPSIAYVESDPYSTRESTVPPPEGPLGGVVEWIWTLPAELTRLESVLLEPGMYDVRRSAVCVEDDSRPGTTRLFELLNPDQGFRTSQSDPPRLHVRWGEGNVAGSLAIQSAVFQMLERVFASAPQLRAVTILVSGDRQSRGRFPGDMPGPPKLGSRVSIFLDVSRARSTTAILSGVEVLSFREVAIQRSGFNSTGYELRTLLTPDEAEVFAVIGGRRDITLDAPDAERTSLNPEFLHDLQSSPSQDESIVRQFIAALDVDEDGAISPQEWQSSERLRTLFERAKVDASQPMSIDDFLQRYMDAMKVDATDK